MNATPSAVASRQYLSFLLGQEQYAFPVLGVREVLEVARITRVPKTPPFMVGVINLRGGVVPVVDLRLKFGLHAREATIATSIIIVEASDGGEHFILGALVDAVKAVLRLEETEIEAPPRVGMRLSGEFIAGIGKK
ncbi:MAG: purine-binding chemotaxis protein CheW, partial [Spirochaetes bacterium]|nr:purine-binding chemotaxis protein CheW [Spirochaetota bacterium]